jgi:ubiquinone/menaquinone biosynthesis C-methylase UbiE
MESFPCAGGAVRGPGPHAFGRCSGIFNRAARRADGLGRPGRTIRGVASRTDAAAGPADRQRFWTTYQPGFRFTDAPVGTQEFFRDVEAHRYALEPHIPEIARFGDWAGRDVLEGGCGIATDGLQFARCGARYTGMDFSPTALDLARRRFELEGADGRFVQGSLTELPFPDASFDLVYSNGVIHHIPETEGVVSEFHRVLRPGGTALVMVYHAASLNHHVTIMAVRRGLAGLLMVPGAARAIAAGTGQPVGLLEDHRRLLEEHGRRYLTDRELFLSNNTDGPGNPLSKVYTRAQARALFEQFPEVQTAVRYLNVRLYPGGDRLAATGLGRALERRVGWHLWVQARR